MNILKITSKLFIFLGALFFISQLSSGHALAQTCSAPAQWVGTNVYVEVDDYNGNFQYYSSCLLYTSPSPRD